MSFWACARTLPQRETFAAACLKERGFQVFAPKIETKRTVAPLFASYLFVFVVEQWLAIDRTPGVLKIVRFGDMPARCPDAEILALMARADDKGVIRLPPPPAAPKRVFAKGARVKIIAGPFQGLAAVHSGMTVRQRELILLSVLGSTRTVAIASHLIAAQ
jgi:transcriptional antiterminator RfaH